MTPLKTPLLLPKGLLSRLTPKTSKSAARRLTYTLPMQLVQNSLDLALFPTHGDEAGRSRQDALLRTLYLALPAHSTRLAYRHAYNAFARWKSAVAPHEPLSRDLMLRYRDALSLSGSTYRVAPATLNQRLAALRHFAREAFYAELLPQRAYEAIAAVQGVTIRGEKTGTWLSQEETLALLRLVDRSTLIGLRDYTLLLVLFGCGLRRAELASLSVEHLGERDGRPAFLGLKGKGNRTRDIAIPSAVDIALQHWLRESGVTFGPIFRAVNRGSNVWGNGLTPEAVRKVVMRHAYALADKAENPTSKKRLKRIRPHDARRTFAKSCREQNGSLEEIQQMLGHQSITTTMIYLGYDRNLKHSINDQLTYLQQI